MALRLGWASLRPDPSSGMRVPWHLLPLDRRAARSSRRSLGVDHMAISGPRLLLLLAFMLTLISVTPPALDRLPWQGRRRTNKCRCAAMVSRGTQTALPRAQGSYRRLPPLSRFRGQQPPLLLLSRSPCWMGNDPCCYCDGWDPFIGRARQTGPVSTVPVRAEGLRRLIIPSPAAAPHTEELRSSSVPTALLISRVVATSGCI